jgi:methylase of polypeptide subunit release factors
VIDHSAQCGKHSFADRGNDCYPTSPGAARALLQAEQLPRLIWDPCCGTGTIVTELRSAGYEVVASDIANYGFAATAPGYLNVDFLLERQAPAGCEAVVANPPYRLAPQFVRHALKLVPFTAMLLRLAFLESASRTDILEHSGLARVLVFRKRLPMMHRHNWDGPIASNSIAFAWFVWRRGWNGNPEIKRIDRS